jgi:hypothetical protein
MAGNASSGNILAFRMSENELKHEIDKYKEDLDNGKFPRASWPHFCARLGYTEREVEEVIRRGEEVKGAYYDRAMMLKRHLTWIRGEMLSGTRWAGQNQTKAIFALKQDHGDGVRYEDKDSKGNGTIKLEVGFGGSDPRGRKASK